MAANDDAIVCFLKPSSYKMGYGFKIVKSRSKQRIIAIKVKKNSPAAEAGVVEGDQSIV